MFKTKHQKFLEKHNITKSQLAKTLSSKPKELIIHGAKSRPAGGIPANGTKPILTHGQFKSQTHIVAPVCNKGAYQVVSIQDIKTVGRKI